jgi:predicted component of type VI protein secretion system
MKVGKVEKDIGQGRRVYQKSQLRLGPYTFTSLLWKRKPKEEGSGPEAVKPAKTRKTSRKAPKSEAETATAPVKPRSPRTASKPRQSKKAADSSSPLESTAPKPRTRKKKDEVLPEASP